MSVKRSVGRTSPAFRRSVFALASVEQRRKRDRLKPALQRVSAKAEATGARHGVDDLQIRA
jgi:hypothetical protein